MGRRPESDEEKQGLILVDTSVWIDFLKGNNTPHRNILRNLIATEEDICLTGIILTEILQGIMDEKESAEMKKYLSEFPVYNPEGITAYIEAANIFKKCARKGKTVRKTIDCLIAAVAIESNLILFHNDKDFDTIASCTDLKVLSFGN